jgi:hypothetical protein
MKAMGAPMTEAIFFRMLETAQTPPRDRHRSHAYTADYRSRRVSGGVPCGFTMFHAAALLLHPALLLGRVWGSALEWALLGPAFIVSIGGSVFACRLMWLRSH